MTLSFEQEIHRLHSRLCSGLADPTRILLLYAVAEKPCNVTELSQVLQVRQPTVSRHLKNLRDRGLVIDERRGASVYYRISDQRIIQALDLMRGVLADMLASQASLSQSVTDDHATKGSS